MELELFGKPIMLEFDPDGEDIGHDELVPVYEKFEEFLTEEKLFDYVKSIAEELTESSYEQDDYEPTAEDYEKLENDMELVKIVTYPDAFMLVFNADATYPGDEILVQIAAENYEIDDITLQNQ